MANTIQTRAMLQGKVPANLILYGRNPAGDPPSPAAPKGTVDVQFLVSQLMIGEGGITEAEAQALVDKAIRELHSIDAVVFASPSEIDKNNLPRNLRFTSINRRDSYPNATQIRITAPGNVQESIAFRPSVTLHNVIFNLSEAIKATIRAIPTGDAATFIVELTDDSHRVVASLTPVTLEVTESSLPEDDAARNALKSFNAYIGDALDTTPFRVYQANHLPGIVAAADLDGDYLAVFRDMDSAINPAVAKDQVDNVRLFVSGSGVEFEVHSQAWAYVGGSVVFPFNISPTEEGNARLQQAIASTPGRVSFAFGFYETNVLAGGFLRYNMPISAAFRVAPGGVTEQQVAAAVAAYLRDNPPPAGEDATARAAAAAAAKAAADAQNTADSKAAVGDRALQVSDTMDGGDSAKAAREDHVHALALVTDDLAFDAQKRLGLSTSVKSRQLGAAQRIALLDLSVSPSNFAFATDGALADALRVVNVSVSNPELLADNSWVEGQIAGQPALARTVIGKSTASLRLTLAQNVADSIAQNKIAPSQPGGDPDTEINVDLIFYDASSGGNEIERLRIRIPVISLAPDVQALTSAAAIAWDIDDGDVATLTAEHNFTLSITNGENGQMALLRVLQDATGSRVMTLNNAIVLDGRDAPVLSAAANAHDNVLFMKRGASWVYMGIIKNG